MAAEAVADNYLIVKNIQSNLGWRDLNSCKSVSVLWRDVANAVQRRLSLETYSARRRSGKIKVHGKLRVEPCLTLVFTTPTLWKSHEKGMLCSMFRSRQCEGRCKRHKEKGWLFDSIREDFSRSGPELFGVNSHKVLHNTMTDPILTGFSFPTIEGVTVQRLYPDDSAQFNEKIDHILETDIVKCILIFVANGHLEDVSKTVTTIFDRQYPHHQCAIGGGLVKNISDEDDDDEFWGSQLVVFSIAKNALERVNFECHSTIFHDCDDVKSDVETKMKIISEQIPIRQHSLAFKFHCCDRSRYHKFENMTFVKYFPFTPIVGCDAMGEIGYDTIFLNETKKRSFISELKRKKIKNLYFAYSTILVILTWDDKINI